MKRPLASWLIALGWVLVLWTVIEWRSARPALPAAAMVVPAAP